jgi:hypothetical protein
MSFEVGDGSRVLFWHGVWCGELPLKLLFPELLLLCWWKIDGGVEEIVFIKGWEVNFDQEYYFEFANIFFVPLPYSSGSGSSFGKTLEGFPLGRYWR